MSCVSDRRRQKLKGKMMKLKIQFGPETRFDQPVRCMTRIEVQQSPGIWASLRPLIKARRLKPVQPRRNGKNFPEEFSA